jgi:hypothetical protein
MMFPFKPQLDVSSHYYSENGESAHQIFEKSLDIYKPQMQDPNMPIVVVVVGSGWMGHRWFIYRMTSWWNSGGPKTIASLDTVCVCIRHRGAFCQGIEDMELWPPMVLWIGLVSAIVAAVSDVWPLFILVPMALLLLRYLLILGNTGSATLDDMVCDVSEALQWIDKNKKQLAVDVAHNEKAQSMPPFVFGGYSSGGHVASTLMSRPKDWKKHMHMFSGILMISGVLAVKPETVRIEASATSSAKDGAIKGHRTGNSNASIASTATIQTEETLGYTIVSTDGSDGSSITEEKNKDDVPPVKQRAAPSALEVGQNKPRWLTDTVMNAVWGETSNQIPSPIVQPTPVELPHLLVGNYKEMFGLQWLDIFFCSRDYHDNLVRRGVRSTLKQINSDHWNILSSRLLREALRQELPTLVKPQKFWV